MDNKYKAPIPDPNTVSPSVMPTIPAPVPIPMPPPEKGSNISTDPKNTKDSDPMQ